MKLIKKIKKWIQGQIYIEIKGWGCERLLKLSKKNDITLYRLNSILDGYSFVVSSKDFNKILNFNSKINTEIIVKDKTGLLYFFHKYKKRKIFAICILLFFFSIYIFSNYIWNVSITGNEIYTNEELSKDIINNYISLGTAKKDINCNELEKKLREKYTDIAWISCEIKGTNLIVTLEETIPTKEQIKESSPCNIVAYKDSIITDIIVTNGTKTVNIGDEIKKNDILITGVVNIKNEYDELIETKYLPAQGMVWGIVNYKYQDEFNMQITDKKYTSKEKISYGINLAGKCFDFPIKEKFENYDIVTEYKKIKIFKNLYLPIGFQKNISKEYILNTETITKEKAKEMANKRLILYIDNLKKKGVSILENNVTISFVDGKCIASGTLKCKEVIGIPSNIDIPPEGE